MVDEADKRKPRKKGQHTGSSSHSDLYTDENPKGTIKGLKFATIKDAEASVGKISKSGKSHAHKIQAAVAMEQRAKAAGKTTAAGVYRSYINSQKKDESLVREYVRALLNEEGVLGKYAWPSAIKNHPMADEPDTEVELMLYQQLHNHFGAIAPLSDEAVKIIQQILDSGEYSDVFSRCGSGPILRGMRLPVAWLEQHASEALEGLPSERKDPMDWGGPVPISPMTYRSEGKFGNVSSWTNVWKEARQFTTQWSADTVPVILHSDCSTGYFMSSQGFKRFQGGRYREEFGIKKLNPNAHEKEVLLFGDCTVTAVEINATKQDIEKLKS